jgi:hypothetical protein
MPRFKTLSERAQRAFSAAFKQLVDGAPSDMYLPNVPATDWLTAFKSLNIKMRGNGMPSAIDMARAVEYLENMPLLGPCFCPRCGGN